jgi:hypothetical protein
MTIIWSIWRRCCSGCIRYSIKCALSSYLFKCEAVGRRYDRYIEGLGTSTTAEKPETRVLVPYVRSKVLRNCHLVFRCVRMCVHAARRVHYAVAIFRLKKKRTTQPLVG